MTTLKPLPIGANYSRLTLVGEGQPKITASGKFRVGVWLCSCGKKVEIPVSQVKSGNNKSCGCLQHREIHGHATGGNAGTTTEYRTWHCMKLRCYNSNLPMFKHYGGRGIKVCDRWRYSFKNFLADVGKKPHPSLSLDRIDVNGDYEPGNVRWATILQQRNNARNTTYVTVDGIKKPIEEWSRETGVVANVIRKRIKLGIDPKTAVSFKGNVRWDLGFGTQVTKHGPNGKFIKES